MTAIVANITEDQILAAFRSYILSLVDCEVIRTPVKRAAMPKGPFIALTPAGNTALSQTISSYADEYVPVYLDIGSGSYLAIEGQVLLAIDSGSTHKVTWRTVLRPAQYNIQVDCYGLGSGDRSNTISMLIRDQYGIEDMAGTVITPLFSTDANQMPIVDGEAQYEERWTFEAQLQINPAIVLVLPQAAANSINTAFYEIP
jgi:hypothetical protein